MIYADGSALLALAWRRSQFGLAAEIWNTLRLRRGCAEPHVISTDHSLAVAFHFLLPLIFDEAERLAEVLDGLASVNELGAGDRAVYDAIMTGSPRQRHDKSVAARVLRELRGMTRITDLRAWAKLSGVEFTPILDATSTRNECKFVPMAAVEGKVKMTAMAHALADQSGLCSIVSKRTYGGRTTSDTQDAFRSILTRNGSPCHGEDHCLKADEFVAALLCEQCGSEVFATLCESTVSRLLNPTVFTLVELPSYASTDVPARRRERRCKELNDPGASVVIEGLGECVLVNASTSSLLASASTQPVGTVVSIRKVSIPSGGLKWDGTWRARVCGVKQDANSHYRIGLRLLPDDDAARGADDEMDRSPFSGDSLKDRLRETVRTLP